MENVFREVNHVFRTSPFSFGKGQGVGTGPAVLMATQNAIELDSAENRCDACMHSPDSAVFRSGMRCPGTAEFF